MGDGPAFYRAFCILSGLLPCISRSFCSILCSKMQHSLASLVRCCMLLHNIPQNQRSFVHKLHFRSANNTQHPTHLHFVPIIVRNYVHLLHFGCEIAVHIVQPHPFVLQLVANRSLRSLFGHSLLHNWVELHSFCHTN